jgi:hypothetical protein
MKVVPFVRVGAAVACATLVLFVAACDEDELTEPDGPGTVVIHFDNTVGGAPLALNTGQYTNAVGNAYTVSLLEYVVSEFHFGASATARDGEAFDAQLNHYRNQAEPATRSVTFPDVPAGDYEDIAFRFGIDGSENVTDAFPDLDLLGMAWPAPMGGGYHYMRNEGNYVDDTQQNAAFTTHLGPSMGNDFSVAVSIAHDFTVNPGETTTITVRMDVNQWYTNPNPWDFNDYGLIMGNPTAQATLQANAATVWSLAP